MTAMVDIQNNKEWRQQYTIRTIENDVDKEDIREWRQPYTIRTIENDGNGTQSEQ